jgi:hypothetical protein
MAGGGVDGSVRIDTSIDGKGFSAGIRGITNSLKGMAAAVGIAFGIGAVVLFGKSAVKAASDMASAFIGLQSVMDGQGRSFAGAKKFIQDYISDGLVPATNAVAAYKNLALRGYTDDQIQKTLIALKDSASFGRQASLTLGTAVQSATEGLKNENSILVDNAGVTKNVSVMWKDYATSIGTTVDRLTKQQKIQAEVNGILEESKYQAGDAAKLAGTYAGQVSALGVSWLNLKVAVGNVIIPVISAILPYIKAAIDALTIFFNRLATIMSLLFNVQVGASTAGMEDLADGTNAVADAQGNLAAETGKAGKAAKGALAAFDEINVLQMDSGGGAGAVPAAGITPLGSIFGDTTTVDTELEGIKAKVEAFKQSLITLFQPASDAFDRFKESLGGLGGTIWDGLKWAWDNILVPLGLWVIQALAPVFLDLLSGALDILNSVLLALQPLGLWLWDNFLKPIADWTGGAIVTILGWIADGLKAISNWIDEHQTAFQIITILLGSFAVAWLLVNGAVAAWGVIGAIGTAVTTAFGAAVAFLTSPIFLVALAIAALIAIVVLLIKYWPEISKAAAAAWEWIKQAWKDIGTWFNTNVVEPVKNAFKTALDWVKTRWETTFTGIKDFVKNTVNTIIDFINSMIRAVAGGINTVISGLNSLKVTIPSWVPVFGGSTWGLNIPTITAPQIPRLATGAVIPPNAEFAAILGDQRSGKNIESPVALMRQVVDEALANYSGGDMTISMPVYLDSEKIYEGQKRVQHRRGMSLIDGASA